MPASATLAAAVIAVVGSVAAVALNGRLTRRAQQRQWEQEATVAQHQAEIDACAAFDAAVALSIAVFRDCGSLPFRPGRPLVSVR